MQIPGGFFMTINYHNQVIIEGTKSKWFHISDMLEKWGDKLIEKTRAHHGGRTYIIT